MMKSITQGLFFAILAAIAALAIASPEVKVVVYKGPKKCSNKGKNDEKPTRVEPNYSVAFHFTVTVDESSVGSRESIGRKIESSHDLGIAPSFPVGQGKVISGLDQGLIGLCKGASAYIIIPPHLAYGRTGMPQQGVGSDATLRYDIEVLDIQAPLPNDFVNIDANKDWKISRSEAQRYFEEEGKVIDLDALWDAEDKNSDGYISWEEFTGPKGSEEPPKKQRQEKKKKQEPQKQQAQQQQHKQTVGSLFQSMDTDQDGKISKAELARMFEAVGQKMTLEFWAESDPDGDGYITFEEFVGSNEGSASDEL